MAKSHLSLVQAAQTGLAIHEADIAAARERQLIAVVTKAGSGSGNIAQTFSLDRRFRLIFVHCHFVGGGGSAPMYISIDSTRGAAYDAKLLTISTTGTNNDVNLRISGGEAVDPSPWTFQVGDALRIDWINPDSANMTWGLEVGLALAS